VVQARNACENWGNRQTSGRNNGAHSDPDVENVPAAAPDFDDRSALRSNDAPGNGNARAPQRDLVDVNAESERWLFTLRLRITFETQASRVSTVRLKLDRNLAYDL